MKSCRHFLCLKYLTVHDSGLSKLLSKTDKNHQLRRKFWQVLPTQILILTVFIAKISKFYTFCTWREAILEGWGGRL
jgi:hypothetical protein